MGNQQSSPEGAGSAQNPAASVRKTCYYELLGINNTADELEIRRAYKKKALELHPDRNFNDEENATKKFAEVQTAYEVLSDPQERAWYDSHRDAILGGDDVTDQASPEFYNVRITTTEEIMALIGRFNSNVPFNDSPTGFFGVLDTTFGQLADEETAACEWAGLDIPDYPSFGNSSGDHESTAKPFYAAWSNFSTKKSFSWKEKWRLPDAPDRTVRRLMEKENKKLREDAIRDFNDAVRSLVAFVKKRDPRYVMNTQSEADRQKVLRDLAAAQAARSRAANLEKLNNTFVADWAQSREGEEHNNHFDDEFATSEDDESEVECFECVVCNKMFKSEKQFEAHEKSKKHIKAVQQLKRQMRKEGRDLDLELARELEEPAETAKKAPMTAGDKEGEELEDVDPASKEEQAQPTTTKETKQPEAQENNSDLASSSEDTSNDEYASREVVEGRIASEPKANVFDDGEDDLKSKMTSVTLQDSLDDDQDEAESVESSKKLNKAKLKRAKKAAKQQAQETTVSLLNPPPRAPFCVSYTSTSNADEGSIGKMRRLQ